MTNTPSDAKTSTTRRRRPRFSLLAMMLVMTVACVTASCGYYLREALRKGTSSQALFVISVLAAPLLLLIIISQLRRVLAWASRHFEQRR